MAIKKTARIVPEYKDSLWICIEWGKDKGAMHPVEIDELVIIRNAIDKYLRDNKVTK